MSRLFIVVCALFAITAAAQADILIDFGDSEVTTGVDGLGRTWNNSTHGNEGVADLLDTAGVSSGASFSQVGNGYYIAGPNTSGANGTTTGYPDSATSDSFYVNHGNPIVFDIAGLDPLTEYEFTVYASRSGTGDPRISQYTFTGSTTDTVSLNAYGNVNDTVTAVATTDATGLMTLTWQRTEGSYGYLGVLEITPEPASLSLVGLGAIALLRRRR